MAFRVVNNKGVADTEAEILVSEEYPVGTIVMAADTFNTFIYEYVSDSGVNEWIPYEYIDLKVVAVEPRQKSVSSNFDVDGKYGVYNVSLLSNNVTATLLSGSVGGKIINFKINNGNGDYKFFVNLDVSGTLDNEPLPLDMQSFSDDSFALKLIGTNIEIIN